jgi:hypothetical protein
MDADQPRVVVIRERGGQFLVFVDEQDVTPLVEEVSYWPIEHADTDRPTTVRLVLKGMGQVFVTPLHERGE